MAGKALRPDPLLELAIQIAGDLDAAHARGIVHRDIPRRSGRRISRSVTTLQLLAPSF